MKKLFCLLCACAMLLSLGLCASAATDPEPAADTVIIGSIYTGSELESLLGVKHFLTDDQENRTPMNWTVSVC